MPVGPKLLFSTHDLHRQPLPNPKKHKRRPLPPERVDRDTEEEPPKELLVREEIKGTSRRVAFQKFGHLDRPVAPPRFGRCQRIDEEHEEDAGVDTDVPFPTVPIALT